jgi:hypothetical protein
LKAASTHNISLSTVARNIFLTANLLLLISVAEVLYPSKKNLPAIDTP